jgi:hypothetical protein
MPLDPNPKVTIPGSGVLLHVLNTSGEPVPVQGDDDGAITTTGGGGGGGGTVNQGTGAAVASAWAFRVANAGASSFITPIVAGDNVLADLRVGSTAVSGANPVPTSNAAASQADGHSASIGSTGDTDTANTLIGRVKNLLSRIPAALVSGRFDTNIGSWLGSTAPTVGQKTMADSVPVAVASNNGLATEAKQPSLGTAGSPSTNVITIQGISGGVELPVNTELPTAALLSDTTANPTAPMVGAGNMLWNGSTWNRWVGTTNGGYVQGPVGAGNAVAGNPLLSGLRDDSGLVRSILGDSLGRIRVVGSGPTTAATSVSITTSTISFTTVGSPIAAQNATVKSSAGRLHGFRVRGAAAGTYYLQWHNVASTGGILSATQQGLGFEVSGVGDDFSYLFPAPITFTTGITWALSTAIASYTAAAGKTVYVDPIWE